MGSGRIKFLAVAAIVAGLSVPVALMAANAPAGGAAGGGRGAAAPSPTVSGADLASGAARGARSIPPNPNEPAPATPGQNINGMHVYLWGGLKSHGEGQHDYPQFLADWSKILTEHGAVVDGSYHMPSAADLAKVDTIVLFKGDAGYLTPEQKAVLDAYVKRGGGIIQIHDSLCGPDPAYMASILGGGKRHGETNFSAGNFGYNIVDPSNPIMQGITSAPFDDEAFHTITWAPAPGIHPLATVAMPGGDHKGEVVPQIWTYEHTMPGGQPARAFVWMQGHSYATIMRPDMTNMLLRGIAWAGKHPVNELVDYKPPAAGGRGGGGGGAAAGGAAGAGRGGATAGGAAGAGRGGGAAGAGRGGQ